MKPDRHLRRSGADYTQALAGLLPRGAAWPRQHNTVLARVIRGLAQLWGSPRVSAKSDHPGTTQLVDARAGDLLERESDPRQTVELLDDWERAWGLPDECFGEAFTLGDRQRILVLKMTLLGAQSRAFMIKAAALMGHTVRIKEFSPFECGISRCGDTSVEETEAGGDGTAPRWQIGPPEMRFYWTTNVDEARLTWFRCGEGQCGVDHHLEIGLATDLECLLHRFKPAHTEIVFDYSSLFTGGPMAGTP